jgi:hypothetical protein
MTLPLRGLPSAVALLVLTLGPTGCGDDVPPAATEGGSSTSSSTGGATTMITSADTTAAMTADVTGSSSGDPSTGTTASAGSSSSGGGTTEGSSSGGGTTEGSSSSGVTTDMTGGTTDMTGGETDATVEVPDFSGDFLLVVSTPIDPTLPLQYVASFDYVPAGMGGGTVDVELQPLALDTGSTTTPRTFFGPPMVFPAVPVAADGTFALPVGILNVAAETNPLFFIDAQANNVVFSALVLDADDVCGTVSGMLVFPIASSLDGTTFAAVRVPGVMPGSLPVVFPLACP